MVYRVVAKHAVRPGAQSRTALLLATLSPQPHPPEIFKDWDLRCWSEDYGPMLAKRGILAGEPDGYLRCKRSLKRAELAEIAARVVAEYAPEHALTIRDMPFADVSGDEWYFGSAFVVTGMGIMNRYHDGTFRAHQAVTRYELAVAIDRLRQRIEQ
jgi:hypothetical protein